MPKMRWFLRQNPYYDPERPAISRARPPTRSEMLSDLLERDTRFEQVPNFRAVLGGLSQVDKNRVNLSKRIVNEPLAGGQKAALIAAALSKFKESDFASAANREKYRRLRAAQQTEQKVTPSGGDKRHFNPTGKDHASTIYGTAARLKSAANLAWLPMFQNSPAVIPCIQRVVRREVMFAKKRAGVGYRVRHRRTWASGVPC